jgi:leucyl/phenylalanyl-tRNA--protein transferase
MLRPELLLKAYAAGLFPMAENAEDRNVFWVDPPLRAIFPLDTFHVPSRLARSVRKGMYDITVDTCFADVIKACASVPRTAAQGSKTWINKIIRSSYTNLHKLGFAHSVEAWKDGELVGGLYGISMGRAFFGESMFSKQRDASKIALVHLVARLKRQNYALLDAQFTNPHLVQFGLEEIPREDYHSLLDGALSGMAFFGEDLGFAGELSLAGEFLQSRSQTS